MAARYMRIRRATLRLQELMGNYLAVDSLDQTRFTPGTERIDLFQLVARTAERIEWFNMVIDIEDREAEVLGDSELFRIVFFNIFNNAIKYSPVTGAIEVKCAVKDGFAEVCISDSGTGISPEDLPHVFDRHYRAPRNLASGSGLGLYIVRRIVELHGGAVSAESVPGQRTTICVRLPLPLIHPS